MPLSSTEIAAMNGGYQGMAMNNMAYSGMIGQGGGVYGGTSGGAGDRMMGGMMSTAASVGAPLATGAMSLLGLDPMSLGLRAGMGAFGAGAGFGGAALAGGAVALPLMAAGAAANYAGNQMYTGAQQQMDLNQQLRQSYSFRNQYGGQGFARSDMSSIGTMVREMSHDLGPGGEMTSFRELTGLAGKMGQMGFAQGVKDVKEFSSRFKEMVKTLKTMATDLGTTLEGAMELAASAKNSGIFGMKNAAAFTSMARATSVSGGLALSEVTGAASIGSQISRSIGGLGRQGAVAGMRTIGQIGTAQQMGVLSEEDIYNVTGLTGAEGRQAYAASAMQSSAGFLQTGRGRRLLASMAGKNGTLDEASVQQLLTGGMSISETMRLDKQNLAKVGRANFIRNEGRLRGAAMERLGGFLPAMQLQEWAASKGIDINDMDDRSMLFAQRQLHMGRDEVDQAIKMAQNMPQILEQQRRDEKSDTYFKNLSLQRKQQGLSGVKQRFEHAKEQVNSSLQKVGQDVFNQGSEMVDSFLNDLFGTYVQTYSKDIDDQFRTMMSGGAAGARAGRVAFGVGGPKLNTGALAQKGKGFESLLGGRPNLGGASALGLGEALNRGADFDRLTESDRRVALSGGIGAAHLEGLKYAIFGESGASKLRKAGFDISGMSDHEIQSKLQSIEATRLAAATGFDKTATLTAGGGDFLAQAYAMGSIEGEGDVRMKNIESLIGEKAKGDPKDPNTIAAKAMEAQLSNPKLSTAEKAGLIGNYERAQGITGEGSLAARYGLPPGGMGALLAKQGTGGFGSEGAANKAFAEAFGVAHEKSALEKAGAAGMSVAISSGMQALFGTQGLALSVVGAGKIQEFSEGLFGRMTGTAEREQAAGRFIKSEQFRTLASDLLSSDPATAKSAQDALRKQLGSAGENLSSPENEVKQQMLGASQYATFLTTKPNATAEEKEAFLKANDIPLSVEEAEKKLGGMLQVIDARNKTDRTETARRVREGAGEQREKFTALGLMDANGQISEAGMAKLGKIGKTGEGGTTAAQKYAQYSARILEYQQGLGTTEASDETNQALFAKMQSAAQDRAALVSGMSVQERRKLSREMAGTEEGAELGRSASFQERFTKLSRRRGAGDAAAQLLGVDMKGLDLKNADDVAKLLSQKGITDKGMSDEIVKAAKSGKQADLSEAIRRVSETAESKSKQDKEKKEEANNPVAKAIKEANEKTANLLGGKLDVLNGSLNKPLQVTLFKP